MDTIGHSPDLMRWRFSALERHEVVVFQGRVGLCSHSHGCALPSGRFGAVRAQEFRRYN